MLEMSRVSVSITIGNSNAPLVFLLHGNGTIIHGDTDFKPELLKPEKFSGKFDKGVILGLTGGQGDSGLLLGLPENEVRVLKGKKARHRALSEETIPPISISEPLNGRRVVAEVDKGIVQGSTEVTENMHESFPVKDARTLEELRQVTHCEGIVRTSCSAEIA
jgi:hypothetical protein